MQKNGQCPLDMHCCDISLRLQQSNAERKLLLIYITMTCNDRILIALKPKRQHYGKEAKHLSSLEYYDESRLRNLIQ